MYNMTHTHTHTHWHTDTTHTHTCLMALCPGLPGWAGTRKATPTWILLKQETVSGSDISWAVCKSALHSRQITTPAPHYSRSFTGRMPFLPPNQQHQSTEGMKIWHIIWKYCYPTAVFQTNILEFTEKARSAGQYWTNDLPCSLRFGVDVENWDSVVDVLGLVQQA